MPVIFTYTKLFVLFINVGMLFFEVFVQNSWLDGWINIHSYIITLILF